MHMNACMPLISDVPALKVDIIYLPISESSESNWPNAGSSPAMSCVKRCLWIRLWHCCRDPYAADHLKNSVRACHLWISTGSVCWIIAMRSIPQIPGPGSDNGHPMSVPESNGSPSGSMSVSPFTDQSPWLALPGFSPFPYLTIMWKEENNRLKREFQFKDFSQAFAFMTEVAIAAERMQHHPEWTNVWNTVRFSLRTHDAGNTATD